MSDDMTPQVEKNPLSSVPVEVIVSVGKVRPMIRELLSIGFNSTLILDRRIDDPVELYVGDRLIARGELTDSSVEEDGTLAVRITEIVSLQDNS
ncbi:MAG TPA: FliM/FliN family flagellar motor C-terminal domain-containing protein [Paenirhodobacter sp.]